MINVLILHLTQGRCQGSCQPPFCQYDLYSEPPSQCNIQYEQPYEISIVFPDHLSPLHFHHVTSHLHKLLNKVLFHLQQSMFTVSNGLEVFVSLENILNQPKCLFGLGAPYSLLPVIAMSPFYPQIILLFIDSKEAYLLQHYSRYIH